MLKNICCLLENLASSWILSTKFMEFLQRFVRKKTYCILEKYDRLKQIVISDTKNGAH